MQLIFPKYFQSIFAMVYIENSDYFLQPVVVYAHLPKNFKQNFLIKSIYQEVLRCY